jgi:V/A-type H+/Na+-transporting ATPase subunit I
MIVSMKKVSIVILEKERKEALKKLRKIGVLHIEHIEGKSEQLTQYHDAFSSTITALSLLSGIKRQKKFPAYAKLTHEQILEKCIHVVDLAEHKKQLFDEITSDAAELERFIFWGDVDPADFAYFAEKGIRLRMYEISADSYPLIDQTIETLQVNSDKKTVRFLLISSSDRRPEGLPPEAFEVPLPRCSTKVLAADIERDKKQVEKIEQEFSESAVYVPEIEEFKALLDKDIEFENVYSGMGKETDESSVQLAWVSGYVPVDSFEMFTAVARKERWAFASSDPGPDDNVPTKLKNNKLVSLIYPLTDFLGTVPGYNEFDISGWFLLFFTIFFGMIFGDGGYGLLIAVGTIAFIIKNAAERKPVNPGLKLILLLSIATMIWGTITCTWFGLRMDQLPLWLKNISLPPLSNACTSQYDGVHSALSVDQNMQIFCFSLALIQLSIAHLKCIGRDIKTLKFIGDLGSLLMLWGMYYIVLSLVVSGTVFSLDKVIYGIPVGTISFVFIGAGFVMSFVFSNYDGSIGKSILESCKNIISVILGVVNVFSDIVSYIRLWAVGLAGSAISTTVNTMAGPLFGHAALFIAFVLLVVFGHGLNIMLNVLSVIVHGVRLNTLEFSSHLGMAWSGYKYEPFRETVKK